MRIIGGFLKSRKFNPPAKNWPTRPTTDFAKEGLYNILLNRIDFEDVEFLDLFGGTGNHCYEFISRGCEKVTYVDNHRGCVNYVKETSKELKIDSFIQVVGMNVFSFINKTDKKFDIIFCDPPYNHIRMKELPDLIFSNELLNENGLFILEHDKKMSFNDHSHFVEDRTYGGSSFSFFKTKRKY